MYTNLTLNHNIFISNYKNKRNNNSQKAHFVMRDNTVKNTDTFEQKINNAHISFKKRNFTHLITGYKTKGLQQIKNIQSGKTGGTVCEGSIPLTNFWQQFSEKIIKKLKIIGRSTNTEGYARSFLKSSGDVPISTSYVHSCSLMYLFNKNTNTHFLYHAEENTSVKYLDFIIDTFMPEGFTDAAIKPGGALWTQYHINNMKSMFDLIKKRNPKTVVNVYHDSSYFPEIVGYKGKLYEIPNEDFMKHKDINPEDYEDKGQASFQILDLQNYNTIDILTYNYKSIDLLINARNKIKKINIPKKIKQLLLAKVNYMIKIYTEINNAKTLHEIFEIKRKIPAYFSFSNAIKTKANAIFDAILNNTALYP